MNDFTKEELEWLYDEIDAVIEQYEYEDYRAYSCRDKVKILIDNYCEHEDISEIRDADYIRACKDCGEIVSWG